MSFNLLPPPPPDDPNRPAVYVTEMDVQELFERYGLIRNTPTSANELRFCQIIVALERDLNYQKGLNKRLKARVDELEGLLAGAGTPPPPAPAP